MFRFILKHDEIQSTGGQGQGVVLEQLHESDFPKPPWHVSIGTVCMQGSLALKLHEPIPYSTHFSFNWSVGASWRVSSRD